MVLVSFAGFSVLDYLYTGIDYSSDAFKRYQSRKPGDGGLSPGHLVFVSAWEKFANKSVKEIGKDIGFDREPDAFNVGGPCVVGAINAAQLLSGTKSKVRCYGAFADDDTAKRILGIVRRTCLDTSYFKSCTEGSSPFSLCLSDPTFNNGAGERSFAVNIGVYETAPLDMVLDDTFFEADILMLSATSLAPCIHTKLTSLLRRGKALGKLNVVGTVFDHINESRAPGKRWPMGENTDESFGLMDLLLVDWDECMKISGCNDIQAAVRFFQAKGVKTLIVTHGPEPIYSYSDGSVFKKVPPRTFPVSDEVSKDLCSDSSKRGDSTGCGDNFAGGVVAYMAEALEKGVPVGQLDLAQAVSFGCASGGATLFVVGGTFIENHAGEKRNIVDRYRHAYMRQIADAKL